MKFKTAVIIVAAAGIPTLLLAAYLGVGDETESNQIDTSILLHYDRADTFYNDGQFEKAKRAYSQIILIDEKEELAWHEKGKILNRLEKCEEAINHYTKYVDLFPNSKRAQGGYETAMKCDTKHDNMNK